MSGDNSTESVEKTTPQLGTTVGTPGANEALSQKSVTIYDEPEHIEPPTYDSTQSSKLHRASISGKKMTGRPALPQVASTSSLTKTLSQLGLDRADSPDLGMGFAPTQSNDATTLLTQVSEWLNEEKKKRRERRGDGPDGIVGSNAAAPTPEPEPDLERLEKILSSFGDLKSNKKSSSSNLRRGSILKKFKRSSGPNASSDTEYVDGDINVPHVEATLDNTKTLAFTGGEAGCDTSDAAKQKDQKHWDHFKQEIVRLTHTLKIRGWRRIPIEQGSMIHVERLSGALTNAVYVVKPPKNVPDSPSSSKEGSNRPYTSKSRPLELLLRVYGPQVEHLIDRDIELDILRRLARKKIGPRLLGYFTNGRFEEFLHAQTLKAEDLRIPETSKQIAKRMRELHDGIELQPSEREAGPGATLNWNRWVDRCEKVITWLDAQVKLEQQGKKPASKRYTRRGLICGVEWPIFRKAVEKYRTHLTEEYGGESALRHRLVFTHSDTQYGNLMRLEPPGESPLLQPANQHRQLVVIDFEYACANTPGYEFANHFTEWCYNYHDADKSYACNTKQYPTPAEQYRFIRSYVMHRPQYAPAASATPTWQPREKTNIPDFMLDARTPGATFSLDYDEEERAREEQQENDIQYLLREMKLWRIENSAFWVAWGIVQAKVPELDETSLKSRAASIIEKLKGRIHPQSDPPDEDVKALQEASKQDRPEGREQEAIHEEGDGKEEDGEVEEAEDFDYLAYAHDRAMFFWGDCLQMGIVKESELPESLLKQVKIVKL